MSSPIRLQLIVEGQNASITGVEQLARAIDSSLQYAAQRATSHIQQMSTAMTGSFSSVEQMLDRVLIKMGRISGGAGGAGGIGGAGGAGGGGGGGGGGGYGGGFGGAPRGGPGGSPLGANDALSRAMAFLSGNGFGATGQRVTSGAGGTQIVGIFKNAEGATARLNLATGMLTANLPKAQTAWQQFTSSIQTGGQKVRSVTSTIGDMSLKISGFIYATKKLAAGIDNVLIEPPKRFTQFIIDSTDSYRKFEASISGVAGGVARAKQINEGLVQSARNLPLTIRDLQEATRAFTFTSQGAAAIAAGSWQEATVAATNYAQTLAKLNILDPSQGVQGAGIAVREALAGEFRSLRFRFEVSPQQIAQTIGKNLQDLIGSPELTMKAINEFLNIYVGEEAFQQIGRLYSTRIAKLQEVFVNAAAKVGESGVFDRVVDRLETLSNSLFDYFDSSEFSGRAKRIGDSLARILENVGKTILSFVEKLTGSSGASDSVANTVELFTRLMEGLAAGSDRLEPVLSKIGEIIHGFAVEIAKIPGLLAEAIVEIRDAASGRTLARQVDNVGLQLTTSVLKGTGFMDPRSNYRVGRDGRVEQVASSRRPTSQPATQPFFDFPALPPTPQQLQRDLYDRLYRLVDADPATEQPGEFANPRPVVANVMRSLARSTDPLSAVTELEKSLAYSREAIRGVSDVLKDAGPLAELIARAQEDFNRLDSVLQGNSESIRQVAEANSVPFADLFREIEDQMEKEIKGRLDALLQLEPGARNAVQGELVARYRAVAKEFPAAFDTLKPVIDQSVNEFAGALAAQLQLTPEAAAKLRGAVNELPLRLQVETDTLARQSAIAKIRQRADLGALPENLTAGALDRVRLPTPNDSARDELRRRQRDRESLINQYLNADNEANQATSSADRLTKLGIREEVGHSLLLNEDEIRQLERQLDHVGRNFEEFAESVRGSMESSLGKGIDDLIWRTGSLRDVLIGFARDITRAFSEMASKNLMQGLFGDFLTPANGGGVNPLGGLLGSLLSLGSGGIGKGPDAAAIRAGVPANAVRVAADGAIWNGGFTPLMAFAEGGIVRRPTLGLIGEGGSPEAVIPMPSGRVPVELRGGVGGTSIDQRVIIVRSHAEAQAAVRNPTDIIVDDINHGGKIVKALKRPRRR
ncbi:MAG TPA: hypothetical protein VGR35_01235 [Tepidisphaeraceae bacterium]|nr:hypothetical protein [Tepidisphaeraceae bacterium]